MAGSEGPTGSSVGSVGGGEAFLALDLQRAVGELGEGDAADGRAFAIRGLAVHLGGCADQRAVVRGDLDQAAIGVGAEVDIATLVVDVEGVRVQFALPARRFQQFAVEEDHVVVEAVQRRAHAFAIALPPAERRGGKEPFPRCPPDVAAQGLPLGGHLGALHHRPLVEVRLDGDALVQLEPAGAVDAPAHDDGVAGHHPRNRRSERGRLLDGCPRRFRLRVRSDIVDVRRPGNLVALIHRPIGPPRRLCGRHHRYQEDRAGPPAKPGM